MAKKSQRLRRKKRIERMKTREQEVKFTKVVEDNSVALERMKNVSISCDRILENFNTEAETSKIVVSEPLEEQETQTAPPVETITPVLKSKNTGSEGGETTKQTPNLKRMTKRNLVKFAKENNIKVYAAMTKINIIKAIEANLKI
jgi:hypothetical protein